MSCVCPDSSPLWCCPQNIKLPLTGDDAAIKKYAAEVEALKKQIGMPDVEDVSGALAGQGSPLTLISVLPVRAAACFSPGRAYR